MAPSHDSKSWPQLTRADPTRLAGRGGQPPTVAPGVSSRLGVPPFDASGGVRIGRGLESERGDLVWFRSPRRRGVERGGPIAGRGVQFSTRPPILTAGGYFLTPDFLRMPLGSGPPRGAERVLGPGRLVRFRRR